VFDALKPAYIVFFKGKNTTIEPKNRFLWLKPSDVPKNKSGACHHIIEGGKGWQVIFCRVIN